MGGKDMVGLDAGSFNLVNKTRNIDDTPFVGW